jgi:hypothetical protein
MLWLAKLIILGVLLAGAVILSSSEIAQGCVGVEIELTCNVTAMLLA